MDTYIRDNVWLKFADDAEESSHEANICADGKGYAVEWYPTAVGQVTRVQFPTVEAAKEWLEREGFSDFTS